MKCYECKDIKEWARVDRPWCDECEVKKNTCTVCGEVLINEYAYIRMSNGIEVGRGHRSCIE